MALVSRILLSIDYLANRVARDDAWDAEPPAIAIPLDIQHDSQLAASGGSASRRDDQEEFLGECLAETCTGAAKTNCTCELLDILLTPISNVTLTQLCRPRNSSPACPKSIATRVKVTLSHSTIYPQRCFDFMPRWSKWLHTPHKAARSLRRIVSWSCRMEWVHVRWE